jgi:hypothetical protein
MQWTMIIEAALLLIPAEDFSRSTSKAISTTNGRIGWAGLEVKRLDNGETILSGAVVDQAALMGILNQLHRLNLTLVSVSDKRLAIRLP